MDSYKTSATQHGISAHGTQLASNYANRPADERFDTLEELAAFVKADSLNMTSRVIDTHKLNIIGELDPENSVGRCPCGIHQRLTRSFSGGLFDMGTTPQSWPRNH